MKFNEEAEQMVLGSCLLSREAKEKVINKLKREHFFLQHHKIIFDAIVRLSEKKENVNVLTITTYLDGTEKLNEIGNIEYLYLISSVISSGIHHPLNLDNFIGVVIANYFLSKTAEKKNRELVENRFNNPKLTNNKKKK